MSGCYLAGARRHRSPAKLEVSLDGRRRPKSAIAGGPPLAKTTDHLDTVPNVFVDVHPCTDSRPSSAVAAAICGAT
jgi:hypothetical protein